MGNESVYVQAQRLHKYVTKLDRDDLYTEWRVSELVGLIDQLTEMVDRLVLAHALGTGA